MNNNNGFLIARYLGNTNDFFDHADVVRLEFRRHGEGITVTDLIGFKRTYATLAEFREEWDMEQIKDRYKANNPTFEA